MGGRKLKIFGRKGPGHGPRCRLSGPGAQDGLAGGAGVAPGAGRRYNRGMVSSVIELLGQMVQLDSVGKAISGRAEAERPLAEFLEEVARGFGLATRRLAVEGRGFNLLVMHEVKAGAPWLLFESHMDTVGVEQMADPFGGEVREEKLFGRGACDTKGSGAAMLWALKDYAHAGGGENNVGLLFTVDEEIAKTGIESFVKNDLPILGWRPVGAVVGEPTLLRPIVAHNGVVRWRIRTEGVAAHSSDPSQGRSAISQMVKVIQALEGRYIPSLSAEHPLTGRAVASVNLIGGGMQINVIPADCWIEVDRRVVPGEDGSAVLAEVERLLEQLRAEDPHLVVRQEEPFIDPPLDPAGGQAFAQQVGRVLRGCGLEAAPGGAPYGTDAGDLAAAGIPAVVLGPGDIAQAHKVEEWIALEQLEKGVTVYGALMRGL